MYYKHNSSLPGRLATEAMWSFDLLSHSKASSFRQRILGLPEKLGRMIDIRRSTFLANSVPCTWYVPRHLRSSQPIFYLHGGAYVGGRETLAFEAAVIANSLGRRVLAVDYRLAPENPYPAALEDAVDAYCWLHSSLAGTNRGNKIVVLGDSAGGGLACALVMKLRDEGKPLPASLVLLSPWTDLSCESETYHGFVRDPLLTRAALSESAEFYSHQDDANNPYISPLKGSVEAFPPTIITCGMREILLADSAELFKKLRKNNIRCELHVWRDLFHVFPITGCILRESKDCFGVIDKFLRSRTCAK